jgi:hypothetical protein
MSSFAELDKDIDGTVYSSPNTKSNEGSKDQEGFFKKIKRAIFD